MKTTTIIAAIIPILVSRAAVLPPPAPAPATVYLVTRAATAEARALLSARLVKMNATKLHWYDDAGVVRVEIAKKALAIVRTDRDIVLVLSDQDHAAQPTPAKLGSEVPLKVLQDSIVEPAAAAPQPVASVLPAPSLLSPSVMPMQQAGCAAFVPQPAMQSPFGQAMPMNGAAMGMGQISPQSGMGMGMTGLMDSLAGGVTQRLLTRTPSCKISIANGAAKFAAAGGDGVIEVNASGTCAWQAQTSVPWIKITSGSGVSGSGVVSYTVAQGEGKSRSGSISIVASAGGSPIKGKASLVLTQAK